MYKNTETQRPLAQYSTGEQFNGLSSLRMAMGSGRGLGQLLATASGMDSIIAHAADLKARFAQLSPAAKDAPAGTSEVRAVVAAMAEAARLATIAKAAEASAGRVAAAGDARGAAAHAVRALQASREAHTLANRAEKTRITRGLDVAANALEKRADALQRESHAEVGHSGASVESSRRAAIMSGLRSQASKMREQSAAVAALPTVPVAAPTQQRIADLANKFNIRTASSVASEDAFAMRGVLADYASAPLAQVKDFDGAWKYYGNDQLARLMADLEFGNGARMRATLSGFVHGLDCGQGAKVLSSAASSMAGLGGLGALGVSSACTLVGGCQPEYDAWCDREVPGGKTEAGRWYMNDVAKCKARFWGSDSSANPPWTLSGRLSRGANPSAAQVATFFVGTAKDVFTPKPGPTGPSAQEIADQQAAEERVRREAAARDEAARQEKAKADALVAQYGPYLGPGVGAAAKVPVAAYAAGAGALALVAYLALRPRMA